jgi:cell wall-associated NlpC family hydrolase
MKPAAYFDHPAPRAALRAELARWEFTPFRERMGRASAPKIGADCVGFCFAALRNVGGLADFGEWPQYVVNGGNVMLSLLLDTLNSIPRLELVKYGDQITPTETLPGDLLVIGNGRITHLGLAGENAHAWHCWPCCGVIRQSLHDPLPRRCTRAIYRPMTA